MKQKYSNNNINSSFSTRKRYFLLYKSYTISFFFLSLAILIIFNLCHIQHSSDHYKQSLINNIIRINLIKAKRGNIYATDKSILAMSIIQYNVHIDFKSISDQVFEQNIFALCNSLASFFKKPKSFFYYKFKYEKKIGNRYYLLAKNLDYANLKILQTFPIFNKGKIKGGFIVENKIYRVHPLEHIGKRTLGYDDHRGKAGLEGAFSKYLKGKDGKRLEQRISANIWKPLYYQHSIEPEDGKDVYSTIDIYLQNIAYHALLKELYKSRADHGCVILMEVKSGKIPAMINLEKTKNNTYEDVRNFSVWEGSEPGSTFKTISILVALEDNKIDTNEMIKINNGVFKLKGKEIRDNNILYQSKGMKTISTQQILEHSSNVGIAKIIYNHYKQHPEKFLKYLFEWNLNKKIGIDIPGESAPIIPKPGDKNWSSITLPWMTFGYNLKLTPLQILTFYNAIANQGKMIKPIFIREIKYRGKSIKKYTNPIVINPSIAKQSSIKKLQNMLEGVVKHGTAKKYYNPKYPYAGKTGTTQLNYWIKNKPLTYNSSFVGYFPSKNPKYSCIVVISKPKTGYYGIEIAVPVFDNIVKSIYPNWKMMD
ncbi:peptidoglycan D,D-transpeptidase FtsI family protein [Blattabacterium cuenoti]|uniref:peptidoglycan D,D-transpeptidase FtsI family protein n=1 Tax=Blattabacterium cuenoti TaxID=1653831 RepID=UPI00163CD987|nr:penicillin-binding protein 2 [Blattabacterium cuenoti]